VNVGRSKLELKLLFAGGEAVHRFSHVRAEFIASILLVFLVLLGAVATVAHGDAGGTQVRVESVTLSPDGTTLSIKVSATINDPTVKNVYFDLSVSYGDHRMNKNKQGSLFSVTNSTGAVVGEYATTTFEVPFQGPGYYLIVTNAYNAANGAWLGSAWVDPREGTAG
jgi:hypothetical protein